MAAERMDTQGRLDDLSTRSSLRYLEAEVHEIKSDLREVKSGVSSLLLKIAEMPVHYAGQDLVNEVGKRVDQLEANRDTQTPRFEQLLSEVRRLEGLVEALRTARSQQEGGARWLLAAAGILFTLANLGVALYGRVLVPGAH